MLETDRPSDALNTTAQHGLATTLTPTTAPTLVPIFWSIIQVITDTAIFGSLLPRQLRGLSALVRRKRYPRGTTLCQEGEHGVTVFVVISGELEVVKYVDHHEHHEPSDSSTATFYSPTASPVKGLSNDWRDTRTPSSPKFKGATIRKNANVLEALYVLHPSSSYRPQSHLPPPAFHPGLQAKLFGCSVRLLGTLTLP